MKIYPKTDYHIFITASLEERVRRKCMQYNNADANEIRKNIEERDALQEKVGYYKIEENTIVVDVTDCENVEKATNKVLGNISVQEIINV